MALNDLNPKKDTFAKRAQANTNQKVKHRKAEHGSSSSTATSAPHTNNSELPKEPAHARAKASAKPTEARRAGSSRRPSAKRNTATAARKESGAKSSTQHARPQRTTSNASHVESEVGRGRPQRNTVKTRSSAGRSEAPERKAPQKPAANCASRKPAAKSTGTCRAQSVNARRTKNTNAPHAKNAKTGHAKVTRRAAAEGSTFGLIKVQPAWFAAWALIGVLIVAVLAFAAPAAATAVSTVGATSTPVASSGKSGNFPEKIEKWRGTVETACKDINLDTKWVDTILAMMQTESGGNPGIYSVRGVSHDIMQAAEGLAGTHTGKRNVIQRGSSALEAWGYTSSIRFDGETCTASIYAGALETKQNVELWEGWLGPIDVNDTDKVAQVAQGYNYGAEGWFHYCHKNGYVNWSYDASARYKGLIGGGTANHGKKVITFYNAGRS